MTDMLDLFARIKPSVPDMDAINAEKRAEQAWSRDNLTRSEDLNLNTPAQFNTLSLPAWLKIAELAGVEHIPAREIASLEVPGDLDDPILNKMGDMVAEALKDGEMLRMEQVAPAEVKHLMSSGAPMGDGSFPDYKGERCFFLAEDRFYQTFRDLAEDTMRAYARPIIPTKKIPGEFRGDVGEWPEEIRVFIENGEITGLSNYYIQVGMNPDDHAGIVFEAYRKSRQMLDLMEECDLWPNNRHLGSGEDKASFTLDFIHHADGRLLFLEGGPEGGRAANPCCFVREDIVLPMHGVALDQTGPVYRLEPFLNGNLVEIRLPDTDEEEPSL